MNTKKALPVKHTQQPTKKPNVGVVDNKAVKPSNTAKPLVPTTNTAKVPQKPYMAPKPKVWTNKKGE